jgi:hypothetical protein
MVAIVGVLVMVVSSASASTPRDVLRIINAQRRANGIPPIPRLDSALSAGCAAHLHYLAANNLFLDHGEDPGRPGSTPAGRGEGRYAFYQEDLAIEQFPWSSLPAWPPRGPFQDGPFHMQTFFDPTTSAVGYAEGPAPRGEPGAWHRVCLRTLDNNQQQSGPRRFYSVPGPNASHVAPSYRASEGPETPTQALGLGDAVTGPQILIYMMGNKTAYKLGAYSMRSRRGAVAARMLGPDSDGYYHHYTILVATKPLASNTKYTVNIAWQSINGLFHQNFSFTTGGLPNQIVFGRVIPFHGMILVSSAAPRPTMTISHRSRTITLKLVDTHERYGNGGVIWRASWSQVPHGTWKLCVHSGGPPTRWEATKRCTAVTKR